MKIINRLATVLMNLCFGLIVTEFSLQVISHLPLMILMIVLGWIFSIGISVFEFRNDITYF